MHLDNCRQNSRKTNMKFDGLVETMNGNHFFSCIQTF